MLNLDKKQYQKEYNKKWRAENQQKIKDYYINNKEKYNKDASKQKEYMKEYYIKHKNKIKNYYQQKYELEQKLFSYMRYLIKIENEK